MFTLKNSKANEFIETIDNMRERELEKVYLILANSSLTELVSNSMRIIKEEVEYVTYGDNMLFSLFYSYDENSSEFVITIKRTDYWKKAINEYKNKQQDKNLLNK